MFRIVRTDDLHALLADRTELERLRVELATTKAGAERATDTGTDFQARLALRMMRRVLEEDLKRRGDDPLTAVLARVLAEREVPSVVADGRDA